MTMNDYQNLAGRTINKELGDRDLLMHALLGLNSEAGELAGIFQKEFQGHEVDREHVIKELGDCLWFLNEVAVAMDITLDKVAVTNIAKLSRRYPEGFEANRSIEREEGDI